MKKLDENLLTERLEEELLAGEQLVWVGQPDPMGMLLRDKYDKRLYRVFMGVVGGLLLLLLAALVIAGTTGSLIGLYIALPLLFITVALGALVLNYASARRTIYAITDRRALVIIGDEVKSYNQPREIQRRMRGTRRGDIIFNQERIRRPGVYGIPVTRDFEEGFFGISDVPMVEGLLLETFNPGEVFERRETEDDADFYEDESIQQQRK